MKSRSNIQAHRRGHLFMKPLDLDELSWFLGNKVDTKAHFDLNFPTVNDKIKLLAAIVPLLFFAVAHTRGEFFQFKTINVLLNSWAPKSSSNAPRVPAIISKCRNG